jgi:hypothetical protein
MARADYPQPLERRKLFLSAWRELAPDDSFGGMTVAEFEAATAEMESVRTALIEVDAKLAGLRMDRDRADKAARELFILIAHGVRGSPSHGEDCALYRSMGYIPKSERKSGLRRKTKKRPAAE